MTQPVPEREPDSEEVPPPPAGAQTLAILVGGQVMLHSSMAGMRMAAPLHALTDGYGAGAVGVLLGLFALAATVLALPTGRLADRYGSRRPTLIAIAMGATGGIIATASQSYVALCVAALLSGASANVGLIALQHNAGRLGRTPLELRRIFGWMGLAPAFANFIGPLLTGFAIDGLGYQGAFALVGVMPILSLLAIRESPRKSRATRLAEANELASQGAPRTRTLDLLGSRQLRLLLLVNWLVSAAWDSHNFVMPILGHHRGLSASVIGIILGLFAVSVAVVRVLLPLLSDKVSEATALRTAMLLAATVLLVYPFLTTAWSMGVCAVALGLSLGGSQPIIMSALHQITPEGRHGESIALRTMTLNMSSAAMPLMFGAVGAAIGPAALFWVMGAAVGAGSWSARRIDPSSRIAI